MPSRVDGPGLTTGRLNRVFRPFADLPSAPLSICSEHEETR